ncbi:hypothetical protein ACIQV3_20885 [Streptomyces sp. NPDC099050]|uniref:hypothetical protein n=1 Tax=Streptomyces sp. NPDC099050 TaxID=3366100 RepID=UPI0038163E86
MDRTRNTVNRLILLTGGSVLLAAGALVLTRTMDDVPRWWAAFSGDSWQAILVTALLATSVSAAVLVLQLRRRTIRRLPLSSPGTALDTRALTAAVASRLQALAGVSAVQAGLRGTRANPCLRIRLVLEDTASPHRILAALATEATPEARGFLAPHPLKVEARITVRTRRRRRIG